jgi:hypothetical protein
VEALPFETCISLRDGVRVATRAALRAGRVTSEKPVQGMNRTRIAELPGVRRAWMGPPIVALGSVFPRQRRGPIPNRRAQSNRSVTTACQRPPSRAAGPVEVCPRRTDRRLRPGTTSRDGVAHEAPLSTVWRAFRSALTLEPHAATRARFPMDAPLARQPTSSSSE